MPVHAGLAPYPQRRGSDQGFASSGDPLRKLKDNLMFFGRWLRNPGGIASIAPSGRALATLITGEIDVKAGHVLELGSGTGAFVPALLNRGVAENNLTLVERDPSLARLLARRYPSAQVLNVDAAQIATATKGRTFGTVICGLGLLNMPEADVEAILSAALARMRPGARLYLFTYGRRCSIPDDVRTRLQLDADRVGIAWRNLPPAAVYRVAHRPRQSVDHLSPAR
jgi:phosphatidylethanolamine/phosphatidyl-N-methylethanolamine N-methyltransferase